MNVHTVSRNEDVSSSRSQVHRHAHIHMTKTNEGVRSFVHVHFNLTKPILIFYIPLISVQLQPPSHLFLCADSDRSPDSLWCPLNPDIDVKASDVLDTILLLRLNRKLDIFRAQNNARSFGIFSENSADGRGNISCRDRSVNGLLGFGGYWLVSSRSMGDQGACW